MGEVIRGADFTRGSIDEINSEAFGTENVAPDFIEQASDLAVALTCAQEAEEAAQLHASLTALFVRHGLTPEAKKDIWRRALDKINNRELGKTVLTLIKEEQ